MEGKPCLEDQGDRVDTMNFAAEEEKKEEKIEPAFRVEDRRVSTKMKEREETLPEKIDLEREKESAEEETSIFPTYVEELQKRCELAEKRLEEKKLWMEQETVRIRERLGRELDRKLESEKQKIVRSFLEVADHFERALRSMDSSRNNQDTFWDGLQLIRNALESKLKSLGVEKLDLEKKPFDPNVSEAISLQPVSSPEENDLVVAVVEQGYTMDGQLLRPAKVLVGRHGG